MSESMFVGRIRIARSRFGMCVAASVAWAAGYASGFVTVGTCLCVCVCVCGLRRGDGIEEASGLWCGVRGRFWIWFATSTWRAESWSVAGTSCPQTSMVAP